MNPRSAPPLFRPTNIPDTDAERLNAANIEQLSRLVQSEAVQSLLELACLATGTPIAGVNLVNNGNTIKLRSLGNLGPIQDREETFCAHVSEQPEQLLIVEDATQDPRFHQLPAVTKPDGILFYAGKSILTPQGVPIGTFYVMDHVPHMSVSSKLAMNMKTLAAALSTRLDLVRHVAELKDEQSKFKAFMDSGPAAAFIKDGSGRYVFVNQRLLDSMKLTESDIIGKKDHELWPQEIADNLTAHDRWVMQNQQSTEVLETGPPDEQGQPTWWQSYKFVVPGSELMLGGISLNVSELRNVQERLRKMANTDALTGLPNRLELETRLDEATRRAREKQTSLCVMFMDLDKFKAINDTYGHDIGDQLLVEFSLRLKRSVRHTDTVFRLAGDEFVVMIEGLKSVTEAEKIAQKILDSMREPANFGEHTLLVSTSIGMAMLPEKDISARALLSQADHALYAVKRSERGRYHIA